MLSARQQHCLEGIGITVWRSRPAADALATQAEILQNPTATIQTTAATTPPEATVTTPGDAAVAPAALDLNNWDQTLQAIDACNQCDLARSCTRKVPGKGFQQADIMIIGEAPGHDEDIQGIPFVGRAGRLLDKMLQAIELDMGKVYVTNIIKCRPPRNRDPHVDEIKACAPFLHAQIKLLAPKVILSVGRISAQNLLKQPIPLGRLREQQHVLPGSDIPLLVTYHPAYLLRAPSEKAKSWEDLKALHRLLNKI